MIYKLNWWIIIRDSMKWRMSGDNTRYLLPGKTRWTWLVSIAVVSLLHIINNLTCIHHYHRFYRLFFSPLRGKLGHFAIICYPSPRREGNVAEHTQSRLNNSEYMRPCHFDLKLKEKFYGWMYFLSPTTSLLAYSKHVECQG